MSKKHSSILTEEIRRQIHFRPGIFGIIYSINNAIAENRRSFRTAQKRYIEQDKYRQDKTHNICFAKKQGWKKLCKKHHRPRVSLNPVTQGTKPCEPRMTLKGRKRAPRERDPLRSIVLFRGVHAKRSSYVTVHKLGDRMQWRQTVCEHDVACSIGQFLANGTL